MEIKSKLVKINHKKLENQKKNAENKVGEIKKEQKVLGKFGSPPPKKKAKPKQKKSWGQNWLTNFPNFPTSIGSTGCTGCRK